VLAAIALYATLPSKIISAQHASSVFRHLVPAIALALLVPLAVTAPHRHVEESGRRRKAAITLTAIISIANAATLIFLIHFLFKSGGTGDGRQLLIAAGQIWATNVIVFALWYWELDGGGPPKRLADPRAPRDFAFVQMTDPEVAAPGWHPRFVDYLYCLIHQCKRVQPHRHDAPDLMGEAADARPIPPLDRHAPARRCASGQHPPLISSGGMPRYLKPSCSTVGDLSAVID
jgi:hypothetical protein